MAMKYKKFKLSTVVTFAIVLSIFLLLLSACKPPCCPQINEFRSLYSWVCKGNTTNIYFKITNQAEGRNCDPDDPRGLIQIKNMTENVAYMPPADYDHPSTGVYQNKPGGIPATINMDSKIRLTASGDKECEPAIKEIEVRVVDKGDFHDLCCPHNGNPWPTGQWELQTKIFGPGVQVDSVKNMNPFEIEVTLQGKSARVAPNGGISRRHHNLPASGKWVIRVLDKNTYDQLVEFKKDVCVRVYLKCL